MAEEQTYYIYADKDRLVHLGVPEESIRENIAENPEEFKEFGLQQAPLTFSQIEQIIPEGKHCYSRTKEKVNLCAFWDKICEFPKQENGYCHYLKRGDWQGNGVGLLWNGCKECGINE